MIKPKKRLLITGVSGLLGNNLAYYFKDKYEIMGLYNSHHVTIGGICTERCDILQEESIKKIIYEFSPSIIIHCASLANVDKCETEKDLTKKINVLSTSNLVKNITNKNVKLVYISSDSVYDGVKGYFSEEDKVNPLNYYGLTKYEGELEVLKRDNSLVLRTNIYGWNIQNKTSLGEWMLNELIANHEIKCFEDGYFSSIYTFELARIIDISMKENLDGVYNCGSADSCSKYEFAIKLADCFGIDKTLITPISIDDFNFKARRGKNLTLNVNQLQDTLNYKLPTIDQSIEAFYKDYKCGLPEEIKQNSFTVHRKSFFLPYGRQWIDENDIQAVVSVLRSNMITQGPKVQEFEKALTNYCRAKYAVAVNSGTSALHITCLAAGVGPGDEVITSPITFVASANCAVYCGAKPVFADIDPQTYNISPSEIEKKITIKTKAVIPVHFAGQSCDMETIAAIVKDAEKKYGHKIFIIEDACHALSSAYKNKKVGSCVFSDMTVLSFHPVKHITTGEGGAVLTNDDDLYKRLVEFRSHGIIRDPDILSANDGSWYYEQRVLGFNYRITDIQCALGISQLRRLEYFEDRRRSIVEKYNEAFMKNEYLTIPFESSDNNSSFHLYVLLFGFDNIGMSRSEVMEKLKEEGVGSQVHYIPVYKHPYYQKLGYKSNNYPNAEMYYKRTLSIPLFPMMCDDDVTIVINTISRVLDG